MRFNDPASRTIGPLVPLVGLLLAGCCPCRPLVSGTGPFPRDGSPNPVSVPAGNDSISIFPCDSEPASTKPAEMLFLAGDSTQANEIHDCQKLVLAGELAGGRSYPAYFGPLAGIYPLTGGVDLPEAAFGSFRVVATVFNWGPGSYAPLGIGPGWNCLWLRQDTAAGRWRAWIAQPGRVGCATAEHGSPPPAGTDLSVVRLVHSGTAPYPRTARWGWDDARGEHYMGIKCGAGWCFIGPPGFTPRESTLGSGEVHEVPGWYDDQHLAIPGSDGRLIPGPWGRITPMRTLGDFDAAAAGSTPVPVAHVTLGGRPEQLLPYRNTWGFGPGLNRLYLSRRAADGIWILTIVAPDGSRAGFEVDRYPAVMHAVDGAVRWRWDRADESAWIGCGEACCTPKESARVF